jgi:uncharacterized protein
VLRGDELTGLLLFTACSLVPLVPVLLYLARLVRVRREPDARRVALRRALATGAAAAIVYVLVVVDAFVLEPDWPELTRVELEAPVRAPLTILHLSDLHLESTNARRDRWLLERLAELRPDLIAVTGDVHQLGNSVPATLTPVLGALQAPLGVYGCIGYDRAETLREAAPHIRWLVNEGTIVTRGDDRIGVGGLVYVGGRDAAYEAIAGATLRLIINHTPDLVEEAAARGAHVYLCGHTHGGQVRVPLWGAIVTNSKTGKRYEAGLYRVGDMWAYTSRGLGLEPRPAPQVRFLCRPEVTLITLVPRGST